MGAVVSVVEAVMQAAFLAQQIAEAVMRAQIQALIKGHEEEFRLMDQLYKFMELLLNQTNLINQLDLSVKFSTDNWSNIKNDLERKNQLLNRINQYFPQVNSFDYEVATKDGSQIHVTESSSSFSSYNFISGNNKAQVSKNSSDFRKFFDRTSKNIKSSAPQIMSVKYTPETGNVQIFKHGKEPQNCPPATRDSKVKEVQEQEKNNKKSKATMGLRVVKIGIAIFEFVQGIINLIALQKEVDFYRNYFSEGGEFEQAKDGMIELMNYTAGDIFNLGCASRAAYYDCRNYLYATSICSPLQHETVFSYTKMLDPIKAGLTDVFIDQSLELVNDSSKVSKSISKSEEKLAQLEKYFRLFYDTQKPATVFSSVAVNLSQATGKYSVISPSVAAEQNNVNSFLIVVQNIFRDNRLSDFESKDCESKKEIDTYIIKESLYKYQQIFDEPKVQIQKIDQQTKKIIFSAVISYADTFYYDDKTGETLFGKKIKDAKNLYPYQQLINMEASCSEANIIPVCKFNEKDENAERQKWLATANIQNNKLPQAQRLWPIGTEPTLKYRYIRVNVETTTNPKGQSHDVLVGYQGMTMSYNRKLCNIEQSAMTQVVTLTRAGEEKPKLK